MDNPKFIGSCECKSNQFSFGSLPIARFYCHCLVCQKYTGKGYSDVTVFLRKDMYNCDINATQFNRLRLPPNIRRGICKNCKKPSLELAILGQLVLVPSHNIQNIEELPKPSLHLFYHRRVEDIKDDLPKYDGYLHSELMVSLLMTKGVAAKTLKIRTETLDS